MGRETCKQIKRFLPASQPVIPTAIRHNVNSNYTHTLGQRNRPKVGCLQKKKKNGCACDKQEDDRTAQTKYRRR